VLVWVADTAVAPPSEPAACPRLHCPGERRVVGRNYPSQRGA
jgi:hypothetical protein